MKKIMASISIMILLVVFSSCSFVSRLLNYQEEYFGFSKRSFTVVEEVDTHGGFLGDGSYYLILDCSDNEAAALSIVADWKRLPLSENLSLIMYGGEKNGRSYGYYLFKEAHMPVIENGYYCFKDRHFEAKDVSDDAELFNRFSYNFSLAVYDIDTNRLYYFEYDT